LEVGRQAYVLPFTIQDSSGPRRLLATRSGIRVCRATVQCAGKCPGYRYQHPREDLTHPQDRDAVTAVREVMSRLGLDLSVERAPPRAVQWLSGVWCGGDARSRC
jgi:hypothetical protein